MKQKIMIIENIECSMCEVIPENPETQSFCIFYHDDKFREKEFYFNFNLN